MPALRPFHLAFPVRDLDEARAFYGGVLGCPEGRSTDVWIDFDLHGHQIVTHHQPGVDATPAAYGQVDGLPVPIPHFGVVLTLDAWRDLRDRLVAAGTTFVIEPQVRFEGQPGEQATLFFLDPSGNALEFKAVRDVGKLFAR